MNRKFNGNLEITGRKPRGSSSRAAKQAFKDIMSDPDMRVHTEWFGIEVKVNIILTEAILVRE